MNKFSIILLGLFFSGYLAKAQQNHSLFLWHDVQESNLLNPAIPIICKWYIGIPVLSSIHANYANSSFTYNQLFETSVSGVNNPDLSYVNSKMHFRNYLGTELHTQLFALGYKHNDYSFIFSITEKNNIPVTYPKQLMDLLIQGNGPFVGQSLGMRGTGAYFNHYREYAVGVSKKMWNDFYIGVRAKLLFGKLNISSRKTNVNLHTDETTFDLDFDGTLLVNTSLPIIVDAENNNLNSITYNDAISPTALILNRKNPGLAFDAGIVYPLNQNIQLSASILDLGFIRWRSNLNTFDASGGFVFTGMLNQSDQTGGYYQNLRQEFLSQMNFQVYSQKYITFLPPRIMGGANYKYNRYLSGGVTGDIIIHKSKTLPAITLSGQIKPVYGVGFVGSYTMQNYSYNNVGAGFFLGKNPVQFYMVTDNILAVLKPLDARMANVRFGLNINLGCPKEATKKAFEKSTNNKCYGMEEKRSKSYMKKFKPWSKKK